MILNRQKKVNQTFLNSFGSLKKESFDFPLIGKYFRRKDNSSAFHILSDKTCIDLDFDELFMFLDRTNSKVGQQFLYNKLRATHIDKGENEKFEELIEELTNNHEWRLSETHSITYPALQKPK